jgi:hypothetical protein
MRATKVSVGGFLEKSLSEILMRDSILPTALLMAVALPFCHAWSPPTFKSPPPTNAAASRPNLGQQLAGVAAALLISLPANPAAAQLALQHPEPAAIAQKAAASASLPTTNTVADANAEAAKTPSRRYINLTGFPFPLGPFFERQTVATEIVKGRVYGFEQEQSLAGITANVRSVVFRMRDNHLLVYNPVAPTDEFLAQLDALDHKGVSHILLGATQYEHKIFVAPFARKFPDAKVWAVPDQWSFPLNLPAPLLGIDESGTGGGELLDTAAGSKAYSAAPDFLDEFEVKLLRPKERLGFGYAANEAALLHKDTKTLALTDSLVYVPPTPQPVYTQSNLVAIGDNSDSNSLGSFILKAAGAVNWRGTGRSEIDALYASGAGSGDAQAQLQRGWERNSLLSLYFGPSPTSIVDPDPSFKQLSDKWIVAPVTNTLIYSSDKIRPEITRWVDDVTKWDFTTIAPSHFMARAGTPEDMKSAFAPTVASASEKRPYVAGDVQLLDELAGGLKKIKII